MYASGSNTGAVEAEIKRAFDKGGMADLMECLEKSLGARKNIPLRIGVTGRSGVGKSTFINTIRGLDAESDGAAETGVTETTLRIEEYAHPQNKTIVFCDLPGVGTNTFPRNTYLTDRRIRFDTYDIFIILTSARIFEDDMWLAKEAKLHGKAYLFIRSQVDIDIAKERKTYPKKFESNPDAEQQLIDTIRSNLEHELRRHGVFIENKVFLIDCTNLSRVTYDFRKLVQCVLDPAFKRYALITMLTAKIPSLIREKTEALRKQAYNRSCKSAIIGAVPIFGHFIELALDTERITSESRLYRENLGLSDNGIEAIASSIRLSAARLAQSAQLRSFYMDWTKSGVKAEFCGYNAKDYVASATNAIPIVGSFAVGGTRFARTMHILNRIIDILESDAFKLHEFMMTRW